MRPVLYEIVLGPTSGTVVLYVLSVAIPALFAWRAKKDAEAGFVEKNRWIKVLAGGVGVGLVAVTLFIQPWTWEEPLEIPLHTYGLMIATGFVAGIVLALREAKRRGLDPAHIMDIAFWALLFSLIGARVLFILVNTDQYFGANFMSSVELGGRSISLPTMLVFWKGGLVFFGGFIGASLAVLWYMRKHRLDAWRHADVIIPSVPLGIFFGRLGCFAAGCCFGKPCPEGTTLCAHFPRDSLAGTQTPHESHVLIDGVGYTEGLYPTQLFEAGAVLLIFLLLILVRPYKRFDGQLVISFLVLYPIARSIIEVFRGDYARGMILRVPEDNPVLLSTSQLISVLVATLGVVLIIYRLRQIKAAARGLDPDEEAPSGTAVA